MRFYADLHVHSKFSRATSRDADLEHLALWARRKGLTVVGTGDFTHPAWFDELRDKLVPAEPGLFRLRPEIERQVERRLPPTCAGPTRFLLEVEISTIYKKGDRTRKVHHLIYTASFDTAARLREKLGAIGNLASDGRPILGLDSRHLLEITLASGPDAFLVPAHVWTPWFAVLGSKSGFDSVEECYGDLAPHIFAVETGLSSDPPMNWRVSRLDRFTLVSNSDAHSPPMLGREASAFETELDYFAIRRALETGEGFGGTVEFFPEEGKYHLDGHRACGVRLEPPETRKLDGRCPACGKPLTVGVMHRVEELADRPEAEACPPRPAPFRCLVPLPEVLAELHGVGTKSRRVEESAARLVAKLGPEIDILERLPLEEVGRAADGLLVEALARLRAGRVRREAGYDGEYGVIKLFEPEEIRSRAAVGGLFGGTHLRPLSHPPSPAPGRGERGEDLASARSSQDECPGGEPASAQSSFPLGGGGWGRGEARRGAGADRADEPSSDDIAWRSGPPPGLPPAPTLPLPGGRDMLQSARPASSDLELPFETSKSAAPLPTRSAPLSRGSGRADGRGAGGEVLAALDPEQRAAAEVVDGPLLVVAGPGTGKTRTLTHRLAHLIAERGAPAEACLAVTFSRRAAAELEERLAVLLPGVALLPFVATFHGLGLAILRESAVEAGLATGARVASPAERSDLLRELFDLSPSRAERLCEEIGRARRLAASDPAAPPPTPELAERLAAYEAALDRRGLLDFDDLLLRPLALLHGRPDLAGAYRGRFRWLSIDEYQDVDPLQYALVRLLAGPDASLCAIGDPDQSIYRFRGADVGFFLRFREDFPGARVVHLTRNYRSTRSIVEAARQAIRPASLVPGRRLEAMAEGPGPRLVVQSSASERAEAELVVHTLERLLGGTTSFSFDSGRVEAWDGAGLSFGDVAVLYRTDAQAAPLLEALGRAGVPVQKRSHRPLADQPGVRAVLAAVARRKDEDGAGRSVEALVDAVVLELAPAETEAEADATARGGFLAAAELLRPLAARAGDDLETFLAEAAVAGEVDAWDPRAERVSLLTLHAAKGLEFPVVFLVGCEDGLLPYARPGQEPDPAEIAEERRLFFVGITRARRHLFLFHSRRRTIHGETRETRPSPFLADVEEALLERREEPRLAPRRPEQLRLV